MGLKEAILQEVREQGIEQGIEKGIEQGIEREKQLVVIRTHLKDLPLDDIAQIAELPIGQVEEIIEDYKAKL